MELFRLAAASTFVTFPMTLSGLTVTGKWIAWGDTASSATAGGATYGTGNGFQNLSGGFKEIAATGVYGGFLATTELPAASPYVLLHFTATNAASQYLLIRTSSLYANVSGINGTNISVPATAGYMPLDIKQPLSLTTPADNSVEKSLARNYFATAYIDATISSRSDPFTGQLVSELATESVTVTSFTAGAINSTVIAANAIGASEFAADAVQAIVSGLLDADIIGDYGDDNSVGKTLRRLYHATDYLVASVLSGSRYADDFLGRTLTRGASGGRTVGQALMAQRNRVAISAGTLTVYSTDDTTAEWTATIATQAVSAIVTDINPA